MKFTWFDDTHINFNQKWKGIRKSVFFFFLTNRKSVLNSVPSVLKYMQNWSTKVNVLNSKFVLNTSIYIDAFSFRFWDGGSTLL